MPSYLTFQGNANNPNFVIAAAKRVTTKAEENSDMIENPGQR
jgi:hypothetical protein